MVDHVLPRRVYRFEIHREALLPRVGSALEVARVLEDHAFTKGAPLGEVKGRGEGEVLSPLCDQFYFGGSGCLPEVRYEFALLLPQVARPALGSLNAEVAFGKLNGMGSTLALSTS